MKRFSSREALMLSAPALVLLAVPFAMRWPKPPTDSGIRVVAQKQTLSPLWVQQGADVAARLQFKEMPDNNKWGISVRLVAGNHLLWDLHRGNVERQVVKVSPTNKAYEWQNAFNLSRVPMPWGKVELRWDLQVEHSRTHFWRTINQKTRRTGRIVLRRAGEKLVPPKVSRDSHLKLLRVEIGVPKMIEDEVTTFENGATLRYPIRFYFERDVLSGQTAPHIECDYEVWPRNSFMIFPLQNGSDISIWVILRAGFQLWRTQSR